MHHGLGHSGMLNHNNKEYIEQSRHERKQEVTFSFHDEQGGNGEMTVSWIGTWIQSSSGCVDRVMDRFVGKSDGVFVTKPRWLIGYGLFRLVSVLVYGVESNA